MPFMGRKEHQMPALKFYYFINKAIYKKSTLHAISMYFPLSDPISQIYTYHRLIAITNNDHTETKIPDEIKTAKRNFTLLSFTSDVNIITNNKK